MALGDNLKARVEEIKGKIAARRGATPQIKTRIEEIKGKIAARRGGSPQIKIFKEVKEKGPIPAIRERIEARRAGRAERLGKPEVEVEAPEIGLKYERGKIAIEG